MFLSFIIPIYNAEMYIKECLDSLLKQDLPSDEYEMICVNDGSTDKSLDILMNYKSEHSNIHVIDKENTGVSSARNIGLEAAIGEYVWFVDADDFIACNILSTLRSFSCENNADVIQFGAYTFSDKLSPEERIAYENGQLTPKSYANNVFVTRSIFKKSFINCHKIRFYKELRYSEDEVFICEVLSKHPVVKQIKRVCYYYRYHAGSAISTVDTVSIEEKYFMRTFAIARFLETYKIAAPMYKSAIADDLMSEIYHLSYAIAGQPLKKYYILKKKLKWDGISSIKRPEECTLKKSYLVNHSTVTGKIFDFVFIHLDSNIGLTTMYCIRLANRIKRKLVSNLLNRKQL